MSSEEARSGSRALGTELLKWREGTCTVSAWPVLSLLTAYAVNSITLSGIAIVTNSSAASPSSSLDHNLQDSFPLLSGFSSTRELEASPIYAELRAEIDRVLGGTVHESLGGGIRQHSPLPSGDSLEYRARPPSRGDYSGATRASTA